jgi:hypothetical protein
LKAKLTSSPFCVVIGERQSKRLARSMWNRSNEADPSHVATLHANNKYYVVYYLFIYPRQPQPPHMAASLSCFSNNFNFICNINAVRHEQRGNIKGYLTWTRGYVLKGSHRMPPRLCWIWLHRWMLIFWTIYQK